ncbi:MAG: response regulator transcription factor [Burkholderiaceae bacterium]
MKVLIIDDHPMVRTTLAALIQQLRPGAQILQADDIEQAERQWIPVDLVLLDLQLPGSQGEATIHHALKVLRDAPIAVVSGSTDPRLIRSALQAGLRGFIPKASSTEILTSALALILAGADYFPPLRALPSLSDPAGNHAWLDEGLSDKQLEVLALLERGMPNKQIARLLSISESTVKYHLDRIFRYLGVHRRTAAIFEARRRRLLDRRGPDRAEPPSAEH